MAVFRLPSSVLPETEVDHQNSRFLLMMYIFLSHCHSSGSFHLSLHLSLQATALEVLLHRLYIKPQFNFYGFPSYWLFSVLFLSHRILVAYL